MTLGRAGNLNSNDRGRLPNRLPRLLSLLLAAGLAPAAAAAPVTRGPHWVQATPSGGSIVALEQAPSSPQTLYALTDNGDLFQTTDGAVTWSRRESRRFNTVISGLAVDPTDAETACAVAYSEDPYFQRLLRTRDGGRSWMPLGFTSSIWALQFDPVHPKVLYGRGSGLQRSVDEGQSWTPLGFDGLPVFSLAIDPFDGQTLLAAVGGNDVGVAVAVWRSRERGLTWQPTPLAAPPGGLDFYVPYLVFDESRRDTVYAFMVIRKGTPYAGTGAAYRSRDSGRSWSLLPAATGILDLATSPDGRLYAAAAYLGVAHSDDAGETWQPPFDDPNAAHSAPQDAIDRVVVSAGSPETLFAAGTVGVWKSTTRGEQWEISSRGIVALDAFSILTSPVAPSTVLAIAGPGLFASHDQGQDWALIGTDYQLTQPYRLLAFDPCVPRTVYGIASDGQADFLTKSVDGGRSWRQILYPYGCGDP